MLEIADLKISFTLSFVFFHFGKLSAALLSFILNGCGNG